MRLICCFVYFRDQLYDTDLVFEYLELISFSIAIDELMVPKFMVQADDGLTPKKEHMTLRNLNEILVVALRGFLRPLSDHIRCKNFLLEHKRFGQ